MRLGNRQTQTNLEQELLSLGLILQKQAKPFLVTQLIYSFTSKWDWGR